MHVGKIYEVQVEEVELENEVREEEGKEVKGVQEEEEKQEEQADVQEELDVQGLPGSLYAVVDDACADGVEAEGSAHHRQTGPR